MPVSASIHSFSDNNKTCYANIRMKNNDPCFISVAQSGVVVKKSKLGIMGAKLFEENNVYKLAKMLENLQHKYPDDVLPQGMNHPVLRCIVKTVLHQNDLTQVAMVLNTALSESN